MAASPTPTPNTRPPLLTISDNDHGPLLVVIGYSLLFTSVITLAARMFLIYKLRRPRGLDDFTIIIATVRFHAILDPTAGGRA